MEKHRNKCAKITCHNEKIRKGQGFCREHFCNHGRDAAPPVSGLNKKGRANAADCQMVEQFTVRKRPPHHKGKRAWWVKYHRNPPKLGENMIKVLIEGFKNAQTWHKSNWKIKEPSRCPHCGEKIRLEPHPSP